MYYHQGHEYNVGITWSKRSKIRWAISRGILALTSIARSESSSSLAYQSFAQSVSQYDSLTPRQLDLWPASTRNRSRRYRLSLLCDVRARSAAPMVGSSGHRRQRARCYDAVGNDGSILGTDGYETEGRPGSDAALPALRAEPVSGRSRRPEPQEGNAAGAASRTRLTSITTKGAW